MARVLVTGAAGFVGSHLSRRLIDRGDEVVGLDCFTDYYDPRLKRRNVAGLMASPRFRLVEVDLRTADLAPIVDGVDGVFHQAAQAGVRSSWGRQFQEYDSINVLATQRLLEACRPTGGSMLRFVYASSSSIYGDAPAYPTVEEAPKLPISPYGVTKLAGELLVRLYAVQYGLPTVSLRYFTVYGPRQRPDMGFHKFLRAILTGDEIEVYGDGDQTRDFTFIEDAIDANIAALDRGGAPGVAYNIGGGSRVTVRECLELMEGVSGRRARLRTLPPSPGDVRHTGADTRLAQAELGYAPKTSLRDGLTAMHAWMTRYLDGEPE